MDRIEDLRQMSDEQLKLTWKDAADTLFRLRLKKVAEQLDTPSEIRKQRVTIARCQTILNQRAAAAASAG